MKARININIDDIPNLLPGSEKTVDGAQDKINKFCSNKDDILKASNRSMMCLKTNKCLVTLKEVNMTGVALQYICMPGCKDKYLEKMRKIKACFSKLDEDESSCSDLEEAMTCAKKEAEGCKILEHHLMKWKKESKEWRYCQATEMRCSEKNITTCMTALAGVLSKAKINIKTEHIPNLLPGSEKTVDGAQDIINKMCSNKDDILKANNRSMACLKTNKCLVTLKEVNMTGVALQYICMPGCKDKYVEKMRKIKACFSKMDDDDDTSCSDLERAMTCAKKEAKGCKFLEHHLMKWKKESKEWRYCQATACRVMRCENLCLYGRAVSRAGCPTCGCKPGPCEKNPCKKDQVCRVKDRRAHCHDMKQENTCPRLTAMPVCGKGCPKKGCGQGMACCDVGCKRGVCLPLAVSPGMTECEKAREKAIKMMKMAGNMIWQKPEMFARLVIPKCKSDGSWHSTQCKPAMGTCWCVNTNGEKIDKTERRGIVDCTNPTFVNEEKVCPNGENPKACNPMMCVGKKCHAHEDEELECRVNPCGETCQVEFYNSANKKVDCKQGLSKCENWRNEIHEKLEKHSMWLMKMMDSEKDFKMPADWKMYLMTKMQMHKSAAEHYLKYGRLPSDKIPQMKHYTHTCQLPAETGPCRAAKERWAYNRTSMRCEKFIYGGCLGNENNFMSEQKCQQTCDMKACDHDSEMGSCKARRLRYFYNDDKKKCDSFIYGGCDGNNNNFKHQTDCNKRCTVQHMRKYFIPMCNKMNTESQGFSYKQCHDNHCWCVDKDFKEISGTLTRGHLKCSSTGRDAGSSPPSVCTNGARPRACVRECLTAMCGGVKEAVLCHADPCNNCAVKFISAVTHKEVGCKGRDMDMEQDKPVVIPCDMKKCNKKTVCKPCAHFPEARCIPDACTCKPVYYDPVTMETVKCDKVQPLCKRNRALKSNMKIETGNDDMYVPACNKKGHYKARQCDNETCWCVDALGEPMQGSKKTITADGEKPVCIKKKIKKLKSAFKIDGEFDKIRDHEAFKRQVKKSVKDMMNMARDDLIKVENLRRGSIRFDVVITSDNDTDTDLGAVSNTMESMVGTGKMRIEYEGESYTADPAGMETQLEQVDDEDKECATQLCSCSYGYKYKMEDDCRVCECLPNPCSVTRCGPNQICQINRNVQCKKAKCNPVAECKDVQSASCPNVEGRFGICVHSCKSDSDCTGMKKCCSNGCGKDCMYPEEPKNSICEKHQKKAIQKYSMMHAVMLQGAPMATKPVMIPRCTEEGDYEEIQCQVPYGLCWCVNKQTGRMIPNTMMRGKPDCSKPDPLKSVSSPCPAGVTMQTCHPLMCAKAHCRANPRARCHINPCGDKCTVEFYNDDNEKVDCYAGVNTCMKRWDMAMYMKKKQMPMGDHRMILNMTIHYLLQGEDILEDMMGMMKQKMINHSKPCEQPLDIGRECKAISTRYYYNQATRRCEQFVYGGCNGNKNNFMTLTECEQTCDSHVCHLTKEYGTCTNYERRWYFDTDESACKQFDYGGCNGNSNNFAAEQMCQKKCKHGSMYGVPVPQCHSRVDNAGFMWKQCHGRHCWCVDQNQNPINETLTAGRLSCSAAGRAADSSLSDPPLKCKNSKSPMVCHLACLHATCTKKMENLVCSADPCNDCAVTFYKPGASKDSWEEVKCDKKDDSMKPPVTACKSGSARCRDECSVATCRGFNETVCVQNPCDCSVQFLDIATRKPVDCEKIAGLCERKRGQALMQQQWDKTVSVPTCEGPSFRAQQCSSDQCWCVDDRGLEVKDSRVADSQTSNCKKMSVKKASLSMKIKADFDKIKDKEETFRWNLKYHIAKMLQTTMKHITIQKIARGSVLVDLEIAAQNGEDLTSKMQFLESQVRIGNMSLEHEGELLVVDQSQIQITLDYTGAPAPTTEAPPSEGNMKQIIIIAAIGGVIGLMLIVAVVIAIVKASGPSKPHPRYKYDAEGYNNHAYGSYDDGLPGKNGHQ